MEQRSKPCIGTTSLQAVSKDIDLCSTCSQISSEMETELVLLRLDACSRLLGNISSHSSFCESSIYSFGLQGPKSNLLNTLDVLRFCLTKKPNFLIFLKFFFFVLE